MNREKRTEDWEQRQLVQWARHYPWGRLLFHIPNENHHHSVALGVRSGVPDLFLPVPMNGMHGLFVEMKRADGGHLSETQKKWLQWLNELGYSAVCCRGWEMARDAIAKYMGLDEEGAK
ncbi:MAG: VRR-NUC domain-containing protein [Atopobiaceae bacterium]|nr:VRR-NUC domain-containing protein [Atopobiaceae bacterium]